MPFRWLLGLVIALAALQAPPAWAQVPIPPLTARVTDQTGTLDEARRQALEQKLAAFEAEKGSQIAVLLVPTTQPESIEQYAIRVAEAWKLGRKGVDDGVLLLVAKDDRALRIEVGYGLEGAIPDAIAKRVIEEVMLPRFRDGDMAGGIQAGVDALLGLVHGEPLPAPAARGPSHPGVHLFESVLPVALVFIFLVGGLLRAVLGRLPGASVAGLAAFAGGWFLLGSLGVALSIALIAFFITLTGSARGGIYRGGGLGGGGGGFGGGGGGFGGGGASGRW